MALQIPEFVKEETRRRCKIFSAQDPDGQKITTVSSEMFHLFYEASNPKFPLYVLVEGIIIEFIKPAEFSKELLDQLGSALHSSRSFTIGVQRKDLDQFNQLIDEVRLNKIKLLERKDPLLDKRVMHIFSEMSKSSQMIVRGGLNEDVINRVKRSAAGFVDNLKDNPEAIGTLSRMIIHDPTLYDHSASVAMISGMIALECLPDPLGRKEVEVVTQSGLYHDVGKTCIPSAILNKPGKFLPEEFEVMKKHAALGEEELLRVIADGGKVEPLAARVAGEHHERLNGRGYPKGRQGRYEDDKESGIHLYSRIVTIADVYSALLMKRIYKPAYEAQDAIKIMAEVAKEEYDPDIFRNFLKKVVGSLNLYQEKIHGKDKGRILFFDESGNLKETKTVVI